ncbi:MAG: hypothetical protein K6E95_06940 [Lachnospiraceae bacterium]|nr:hypothetical protein [Lachnospiraceae bacterium]
MKKIAVLTALVLVLAAASPAALSNADSGYSYNYDFWGEEIHSPNPYAVKKTLTHIELGLEDKLSKAQGLFVKDNLIYICDTGNNRIIVIECVDEEYNVKEIIDSFEGAELNTFNSPNDIFVTDEHYFIADTENNRIVKLTKDLQFVMEFTKPDDINFDQSITFLPSKIIVDGADRVFCLVKRVNKGIVKYENDGKFNGFVGATPVTYDLLDYIWKTWIASDAQADAMSDFVPTEYDNIATDNEGFMYVVTANFYEGSLSDGSVDPIRRLNSLGNDILVQNGDWVVIGDLNWADEGVYTGASRMVDITALDDGTYFALDRIRGRIFGYDDQGNILCCFGGNGNKDGYFRMPTALEHMGHDLLVLDSQDAQLTVLTPTFYGKKIFSAIYEYQQGRYDKSAEEWKEVLMINGNNELAYKGIGRALLRQDKYEEAMSYFKIKYSDKNYGDAFQLYRKQWVEDHIVLIFIVIILVLVVPLLIGRIKKVRWEVKAFENDSKKNN